MSTPAHRPARPAAPGRRGHSPYAIRGAVELPESELRWRFSRSSGPGGQHVNTSDTQVELRFDLAATSALPAAWKERALGRLAGRLTEEGVLIVRSSGHRSQWRNREEALRRMAGLLAEASAPPPKARRERKVPRAVVERRLREKRHRAELKRGRGRGGGGWD
ncbi:alternative ribosome rescue aminoacyl-tRNA hydrolase ArfB [Streptomyces hoynatensis]|uniref:alternative ribosome rescue aminoacyl-tRNA hydrolase ArfB n=1 Tax=Streptomyces hoynatensis TaxID=1141874 RepID=UPI003BABE67D